MRNEIRCLQPEEIEITSRTRNIFTSVCQALHGFWKNAIQTLLASDELEVIQKVDRHGNIYWQAYDPVTGKSFSSGSEVDVSMWIEQLYRH
ncbi:MAG: hypothetical protein RMX68_030265 [Aulosira sp. ZfuVER01]|nr:hypothetical protein [Aulosira sp. ZfuVER01]MDZ7997724.1 hypothetical protein [Aulosira sp. DedVER01a]MDZ8052219.1 hypothetical protein [Aulosira sp. ZfuCHP01]